MSNEDPFAHWGETKSTMRAKAIMIFERMLREHREGESFPQDGSKGQAEAYHFALIESLKEDE
tara:strand:+ start:1039 stop:1227 length:189 start_codon:yes stop_codon:yes gene_type:complete